MRNAALVLGIIGGIIGMVVGFFGYGYTEVIDRFGEIPDIASQVDHVGRIRAVALLAPILAIAGGVMARAQAMTGLSAILALLARRPDPH